MGTHSLIYFNEIQNGKIITLVTIFQHSDGYPGYVGLILANFLKHMRMVPIVGIPIGTKTARRYSCLVAQYIAQQKDSVGYLYIVTKDSDAEWIYYVQYNEDEGMKNIKIIVEHPQNQDNKVDNEVESSNHRVTMSIDEFQKYCYYYDNDNNDDDQDIDVLVQHKIDTWKLQRVKLLQRKHSMYCSAEEIPYKNL